MAILSFQAMFFMVRKGVDPSLCSEFLCKSPRVQPHFTLRLAPKRSAFSTKTQCIQHQNTVHLASKRSAFSSKWPKAWCKLRFYAICIHLVCIFNNPLFASKPTFARVDFLRQGERLVEKVASNNVKIYTENKTFVFANVRFSKQVGVVVLVVLVILVSLVILVFLVFQLYQPNSFISRHRHFLSSKLTS